MEKFLHSRIQRRHDLFSCLCHSFLMAETLKETISQSVDGRQWQADVRGEAMEEVGRVGEEVKKKFLVTAKHLQSLPSRPCGR